MTFSHEPESWKPSHVSVTARRCFAVSAGLISAVLFQLCLCEIRLLKIKFLTQTSLLCENAVATKANPSR